MDKENEFGNIVDFLQVQGNYGFYLKLHAPCDDT